MHARYFRPLAGLPWALLLLLAAPGALAGSRIKDKLVLAAEEALGPMPQYTGKLRPRLNAFGGALTLRIPLVEQDGSGKYVAKLTFGHVSTTFSSATISLFEKVSALERLTFSGIHRDKVVFQVELTRAQYKQLGLKRLEESLGAYQGRFIERLLDRKITEHEVQRRVDRRRLETYRKVFAKLPGGQVRIVEGLLR